MAAGLAAWLATASVADIEQSWIPQSRSLRAIAGWLRSLPDVRPRDLVIVSGTVSVTRGGEHISDAGAGEFFGEMSVFDGETRSATVAAAAPVHVLSLERHELFQLMDEQPSLAIAMCQTLAQRVRDAMGRDDQKS